MRKGLMSAGGYSDDGAWMSTVEFLNYETGQWVSHTQSRISGEANCLF